MATKLGIDDVGGVLEALSTIKNKWEVLGLQIGMHPNVLDGFKKEFGQNPDDCLLAVLKGHLRKFNPEPSWNLFVMALRSESVQEPVLAKEIAAKFCLEPQSPGKSAKCIIYIVLACLFMRFWQICWIGT